ncbi:hypothetical protein PFISCL1PPCAC_27565, partial [Pristionchus fissidentatus]
ATMSLGEELNIDTANKLHNGVDLMNRGDLSPSQNRELQRFIDANNHLLHYSDRELPPEPPTRIASNSNYSALSKRMDHGNPNDAYKPLDQTFGDGARGRMTNRHNSRSVSPEKKMNGGSGGDWMSHTFPRSMDDSFSHYGSQYGRSNLLNSPNADTLKRKGVSWSDLVGGGGLEQNSGEQRGKGGDRREQSPDQTYHRHRDARMSQYGSLGSVSREYNMSPAYSTMSKGRDNYNRFETDAHAHAKLMAARQKEEDASKFSGYGDRPGSGVELTKHTWQGGEIISTPDNLPRGPKPRRMYYSPIGDGVVAADGIELKRKPTDLTPRVTVTQLTHVERGRPGHDGYNEYIKEWNTAGSAPASEYGGMMDNGPGSGRGLGAMSPASGRGGPADGGANNNNGGGAPKDLGKGDPYGTLSSLGSRPDNGTGGNRGSPFDRGDHGHPDGRMSNASTMFSDPGYRYTDIQHGYAITNPRELIHQYATTTPTAVMEASDNTPGSMTTATYKKKVTTRIEERQGGNVQGETYAPYPPYRASSQTVSESRTLSPTNFVRKLRDDTMTNTQREANTHIDAQNNKDPNQQNRIQEIRQKTNVGRTHDDIDSLTNKMMEGLRNCPTPSRY